MSGSGCQVSRGETTTENGEGLPIVIEEALKIPGVETAVGRPYGIGVHKAFVYAWEPIEERMTSLLWWMGENLPVELSEVDMSSVASLQPQEEVPVEAPVS